MREIWKDIKDYEGLYQVSNWGRVKSLNYRHTGKEMVLQLNKTKYGYLLVCLYKDGKSRWFSVHRLVASTFLENPDNLPCVNHKDEDKTNNFAGTPENDYTDGNLEYCTTAYNNSFGTRPKRAAEHKCKPVLQYTKTGDFIREWKSIIEVKRELGYGNGNISNCCLKKLKSAYGYIWKFKE